MRSSRKLFTAPRYEYFKKYNMFVNDNVLVNSTDFRYMYSECGRRASLCELCGPLVGRNWSVLI